MALARARRACSGNNSHQGDQDRKRACDLENPSPPPDLHDVLNDLGRVVEETVI